ncbi:Tp53-Binding Protein 1 [Manis pentadactyla]|nr:Tp53-Binding Protein 1 [Manis pentadactyla]
MSCRTSTTRAYKSRRASPAELGEQARARALRGPTAMVTQPRCPWPDKRGSPARDRHLSLPRLSRDPSPSSTGAPPPSPVTRKCLSEGTSLTSQGFDVKGCVPIREHWDQERRETRGRHPRLGSDRGHLPRPQPFGLPGSLSPTLAARAAAVRGADRAQARASAVLSLVPRGCEGRLAHKHIAQLRRSAAHRPRPPQPSGPDVSLTGVPRCHQQRAPRPRVSRATVAFDCYCGNRSTPPRRVTPRTVSPGWGRPRPGRSAEQQSQVQMHLPGRREVLRGEVGCSGL